MQTYELKLYRGYANDRKLVVSGHAFKKYPASKNLYDRKGFRYVHSVVQLFTVKTLPNVRVIFKFGTIEAETKTLDDGYFRFTIPHSLQLESGWHTYSITLDDQLGNRRYQKVQTSELLLPNEGGYMIISDIDDTFLISYSSTILKKLYVLLTKNVESRSPFNDVVKHYQLLSLAGKTESQKDINTFFYVSSSEWNLYDYIMRFIHNHDLPKAVIKLKKIKENLTDFFRAGTGSHHHKKTKIEHLVTFYPHQQFILLGDDSQQDPYIYEEICKTFPTNIKAVYIRQTGRKSKPKVTKLLSNISSLKVSNCYFSHSNEAILHSVREGIITREALEAFEKEHPVVI